MVGGTAGKIDHVRTTDTSKTQLILSKEDLDTRSLEVQRSSADIYVTGGSHETDAFFFGDSGSYDEVRGEGADRVVGPRLGGADMGPVNMQHRMRDAGARWWSQLMDKISTFSPAHCTDRRTFITRGPWHFRTR